jgi:hypothetical protein
LRVNRAVCTNMGKREHICKSSLDLGREVHHAPFDCVRNLNGDLSIRVDRRKSEEIGIQPSVQQAIDRDARSSNNTVDARKGLVALGRLLARQAAREAIAEVTVPASGGLQATSNTGGRKS